MKSKIVSLFSSLGALLWGCIGGSCGIVCLASGCCGGTALFGLIGLSGASLGILNKLTPVFLILTIVSLGYAFYNAYKPKPVSACCDCSDSNNSKSSDCCEKEKKQSFHKSKSFLWITTILCAVLWLYPLVFKSNIEKQENCCTSSDSKDSLVGPKIIKIQAIPCCSK